MARYSKLFRWKRHRRCRGFSLVELIVVIGIIALLSAMAVPTFLRIIHAAKRAKSMANLRGLVAADLAYADDNGSFPPMDTLVPSSISQTELQTLSQYSGCPLPAGSQSTWPKRNLQPDWYNDPMAQGSHYAEGLTAGGGIYTGYAYLGSIGTSAMVLSGAATLTHPEQAATPTNRGVLWCTVLDGFNTSNARSYECFYYNTMFAYPDFLFSKTELEGQIRAYSDGSEYWVNASNMNFDLGGPDLQIVHFLGNYYY